MFKQRNTLRKKNIIDRFVYFWLLFIFLYYNFSIYKYQAIVCFCFTQTLSTFTEGWSWPTNSQTLTMVKQVELNKVVEIQ
jgi:hypothetical protein